VVAAAAATAAVEPPDGPKSTAAGPYRLRSTGQPGKRDMQHPRRVRHRVWLFG
jgi:hypothetical protein